jgi:hypothetical protein
MKVTVTIVILQNCYGAMICAIGKKIRAVGEVKY